LTAVIVSGGKQYRVAPGDRILVDRLDAEAGAEISISSVLMLADSDGIRLAAQLKKGDDVMAKVLGHPRGPKIDVLRYKSKKRVRVHRGARADLTALEIVTVAGQKAAPPEVKEESDEKPRRRRRARPEAGAETVAEVEATAAAVAEETVAEETVAEEPDPDEPQAEAKPARRRTTKAKKEPTDGA
jgi:large subunit ribosomal protein L21